MPDPFGETPEPWWRRMWKKPPEAERVPKRYLVPASVIGATQAVGERQAQHAMANNLEWRSRSGTRER